MHIIFVIILSLIVIWALSYDVCSSISDYISAVGSIASLYGIVFTLWQISQVKRVTEAVSEAVDKKLEEIDSLIVYADVKRHIEICNSINLYLMSKKYEIAAIKIEQLKEVLINLKQSKDLQVKDIDAASSHIFNLNVDLQSIRKYMYGTDKLNVEILFSHISDVCIYLQDLSSKIKRKNYDKREV